MTANEYGGNAAALLSTMAQAVTSAALLGAYRKGRRAAEAGQRRASPYTDKRGGPHANVVTFSRAFMRMWYEGFDDAKAKRPESYKLRPPRDPNVINPHRPAPGLF